jgi:hypothetical protein
MNSSFSKKRYISEANSILESRFIKDRLIESKDTVLNEQLGPSPEYKKWAQAGMACVITDPNKKEIRLKDNSIAWLIGDYTYYSNYRAKCTSSTCQPQFSDRMFYWFCEKGKPIISTTPKGPGANSGGLPGASSTAASSGDKKTINQTLQWKDCSKTGVYQLACKDSRPKDQNDIMKIQGCIGVKQDGYFGERTMKTLNKKYPNLGGVVRVGDINTICQSQITPVGLSGDNDMDAVPGNQQEPRQVTPAQQINKAPQTQIRSNQGIPTPQLSQQTIQQAAKAAQTNPTLRPK